MSLKPIDARLLEARSRARKRAVRVEAVQAAQEYRSRSMSQPGVVYTLTRTRDGWQCGCAGYRYTLCCHHLGSLARRAEREGWEFGKIAPAPVPSSQPTASLAVPA